ncbi:MAG: hypothetical protein H0X51_08255 [Parachlamydiaceae bacterium]|nr:hypothetical protein [Parachlamydiaceae bacterium]
MIGRAGDGFFIGGAGSVDPTSGPGASERPSTQPFGTSVPATHTPPVKLQEMRKNAATLASNLEVKGLLKALGTGVCLILAFVLGGTLAPKAALACGLLFAAGTLVTGGLAFRDYAKRQEILADAPTEQDVRDAYLREDRMEARKNLSPQMQKYAEGRRKDVEEQRQQDAAATAERAARAAAAAELAKNPPPLTAAQQAAEAAAIRNEAAKGIIGILAIFARG